MTITYNIIGLETTIAHLQQILNNLNRYAAEIVRRLSLIGYDVAYQIMAGHIYTGETIDSLTIVENDDTHFTLMASSRALIFFEFGAGINGGGHPQAGGFGFGPGTYPGQTHALDPNGWYYPTDDPALIVAHTKDGQGLGHSYGNPPRMPFYYAKEKMKQDLLTVAREVFAGG